MDFPTDPRKIAERIRRYERALRRDLETMGSIDDGAGKRYMLGALYLALGDVQGALESYAWLQKVVPNDSGEPVDSLCWTLALYRAGDRPAASRKLVQTMLRNLYLNPALVGIAQPRLDIWRDDLCRLNAAASQDTHGDLVPPTFRPDRPVRAGS